MRKILIVGVLLQAAAVLTAADLGDWEFLVRSQKVLIDYRTLWRYAEDFPYTAPDASGQWVQLEFDDSLWKTGLAPFGYGDEDRVQPLIHRTNLADNDGDYFFRAVFSYPAGPARERKVKFFVASDNAADIFFNGDCVDHDPDARVKAGHEFEHWNRTFEVDPHLLREKNILAAHLYNDNVSTDAYFELRVVDGGPLALRPWRNFLVYPSFVTILSLILFLFLRRIWTLWHLERLLLKGQYQAAQRILMDRGLLKSRQQRYMRIVCQIYEKMQQYPQLLETAERYAALYPQDFRASVFLAQALSHNKRFKRAIELLREILRHKEDTFLQRRLAELLLEAGHQTEAEEELQVLLKKDPSNLYALETLGELKLYAKDPHAIVYFQKLLSLNGEHPGALFHLGQYYQESGQLDLAIPSLQNVVNSKSAFTKQAMGLLVKCLLTRGMHAMAKSYLDKLSLEDISKQEMFSYAQSYEECKDYGYALKLYQKISDRDLLFRDTTTRITRLSALVQGSILGKMDQAGSDVISKTKTGNRYSNFEVISSGGMGIVYKALDKVLARHVAIKVLSKKFLTDQEMLIRFLREAQAVARLNHPHIISVYDVSQEDVPYIAMELFEGQSLEEHLNQKKVLTFGEVCDIAWQLADALAYAHAQNIFHRDIKPANVLIDKKGGIKVADFGVAHFEALSTITQTGQSLGSPLYMSPEQARGEEVDGQTDIYSYGITLLEMSSGKLYLELLRNKTVEELLERNASLQNQKFKDLVIACCERDKKKRPANFGVVLESLKVIRGEVR